MRTAKSIANADPIQFPDVIFGMICTYVSFMMCHAMYRILSIIMNHTYITSCDPHHDIYRFVTGKSSGVSSNNLEFYLAYLLAFYLAYFLAFYLADSCRAGANPQTLILMAASWPNHEEVFVGAL